MTVGVTIGGHDRQIGNAIMVGVVAELDESKALARVDVEGMRSDWLQWCAASAGPGARTWTAPEVGTQVVVACPHGDVSQGVILGALFQNAHAAPAASKSIHAAEFSDGTRVEYDRDSHTVTVNVGSGHVIVKCATATVEATDKVTLSTPTVHATGDIVADGKISAGDTINAGGDISTLADVKAGPISLKLHKHNEMGDGSPTSPAIP